MSVREVELEFIDVNEAFRVDFDQAQLDFDDYLLTRPYRDENERLHSPDNGQFINPERYFNERLETPVIEIEDMSIRELTRAQAESAFYQDYYRQAEIASELEKKKVAVLDPSEYEEFDASQNAHFAQELTRLRQQAGLPDLDNSPEVAETAKIAETIPEQDAQKRADTVDFDEITHWIETDFPDAVANKTVETTPENEKRTMRGLGATALAFIGAKYTMSHQRFEEFIHDEDHGPRNRAIVAGSVAALALLGGVLLAKGMGGFDHHAQNANDAVNATPTPSGSGSESITPTPTNPPSTPPVIPPVIPTPTPEAVHHVTHLHHGGTVWGIAQENLAHKTHHEPSNYQVLVETRRLLHLNHISWLEAHHLKSGTEIKID